MQNVIRKIINIAIRTYIFICACSVVKCDMKQNMFVYQLGCDLHPQILKKIM